MTRPAPLTPPDSDLSDFGFMPLEVGRFRRSDLVTQAPPEAIVAAILLWGAAWHSKPAASLSNDDRSLAQAAGYGRAVSAFAEIKADAMRGFVECADGRLYHPVVAEHALEAWEAKLKRLWRTECARRRKHNERHPDAQLDSIEFEDWRDERYKSQTTDDLVARDGMDMSRATGADGHARQPEPGASVARDGHPEPELEPARIIANADQYAEEKSSGSMSQATGDEVTRDNGQCHADNDAVSRESFTPKGQGQGQGQGDSIGGVKTPPSSGDDEIDDAFPKDLLARVNLLAQKAGLNVTVPKKLTAAIDMLKTWEDGGIDFVATIAPTIERLTRENPSEPIYSLRYFDAAIRKAHALTLSAAPEPARAPAEPKAPIALSDGSDERIADFRRKFAYAVGEKRYAERYAPEHVALEVVDGRFLEMIFRTPAEQRVAMLDEQDAGLVAGRLGLTFTARAL